MYIEKLPAVVKRSQKWRLHVSDLLAAFASLRRLQRRYPCRAVRRRGRRAPSISAPGRPFDPREGRPAPPSCRTEESPHASNSTASRVPYLLLRRRPARLHFAGLKKVLTSLPLLCWARRRRSRARRHSAAEGLECRAPLLGMPAVRVGGHSSPGPRPGFCPPGRAKTRRGGAKLNSEARNATRRLGGAKLNSEARNATRRAKRSAEARSEAEWHAGQKRHLSSEGLNAVLVERVV